MLSNRHVGKLPMSVCGAVATPPPIGRVPEPAHRAVLALLFCILFHSYSPCKVVDRGVGQQQYGDNSKIFIYPELLERKAYQLFSFLRQMFSTLEYYIPPTSRRPAEEDILVCGPYVQEKKLEMYRQSLAYKLWTIRSYFLKSSWNRFQQLRKATSRNLTGMRSTLIMTLCVCGNEDLALKI